VQTSAADHYANIITPHLENGGQSSDTSAPPSTYRKVSWGKKPVHLVPRDEVEARPSDHAAQKEDSNENSVSGMAVEDEVPRIARPLGTRTPEASHDGSVRSVCVVGGGPSGLACCQALCASGLDVTLVQESRGLGGKLCTKFVNGKDDPSLHFDMGVQFLQPAGAFAQALEGVIAPWPSQGRFKKIKCSGDWQRWKIVSTEDLSSEGYVVGVPSMSAIGRHLANQCKGLVMHIDRTAKVRGKNRKTGQWMVEWKREAATGGQLKYRPELADVPMEVGYGDFDAVVLAFEANKIVRGCKSGYKMTESSATPELKRCISGKARTSQMWNLMVAFDVELPMPWDAATIDGHPSIAWIAVDSSKPQRAKTPQCFMVFSTQAWADWKQWGKKEVERELLQEFLGFLHQVLGERPPKPSFVLSGRWGNNTETVLTGDRPRGEFPMRAVSYHDGKAHAVWDADGRMGATGDWTRGFSASDAYTAGLEMASAVMRDAGQ
jgi:predicted NAD/FAD-dependent oxidoreductase